MAAITNYALLASTQPGDKQTQKWGRSVRVSASIFYFFLMSAFVGVKECALLGSLRTHGEIDERRGEETGAIGRKDRGANLPGLLLVRQIFSRWGGSGGEVRRGSENGRKRSKC